MRDIAEKSGVNQSTVSRALRNDQSVSEELRKKVCAMADAMGYRPNPFVSAFTAQVRGHRRSPQHASIAILNARRDDDQLACDACYTQGAVDRAEQLGFRTDIFSFQSLDRKSSRLLKILRSRGIRGLLILPIPLYENNLSDINVSHLACATIDLTGLAPAVSHAVPDYFRHMVTVLNKLKSYGYKRIGFCTKPSEVAGFARYSIAAYLFFQQQMPVSARLKVHVDETMEVRQTENSDAFLKWLEKNRPDAVISNEPRFLDWMKKSGIKVPDEIGFASLSKDADQCNVAGIDQRQKTIGAAAMDVVIGHIFRNEYGLPEAMKTIFIDGIWRDGKTIICR